MKNLTLRGDVWHFNARINGRRFRVSTGARTEEGAARVAEQLRLRGEATFRGFVATPEAELLSYLAKSRERALRRDRKRSRVAELTPDDMRTMYHRSGGRCELTGIPFSLEKADGTFRRPLAPSIDRLDNGKPYSLANCRLIALAVNIGINEWGDVLFRRIALAFLSREEDLPVHSNGTHLSAND